MKITNNHDAVLNVAGVNINPGATVGLNAAQARQASASKAVERWVELELLTFGEPYVDPEGEPTATVKPVAPVAAAPVIPGIPGVPPTVDRAALEARAKELGVGGVLSNFKLETLQAKIAEAEAQA